MAKLTAMKVKGATTPGQYADGAGLKLVVKSAGSRSWVLRMQVNGQRRDFGLGSLNAVSLAEARDGAETLRRQFRAGIDPVAAKRKAREKMPTFAEAARQAHAEQKAGWRNLKHRAQWIATLETYAFPAIGDVEVDKIDGPAVRDVLLPIWLSKPETARRVRQRIAAVLDWCCANGLRAEAPMRSISKGLPRQPKNDGHFSALPYGEVPALMTALGHAESIGRLALQFLILTAARSGEVRGAEWAEVDVEDAVWTVPAARMKAGKEHLVPLSAPALAIVKRLAEVRTGSLIFPGVGGRSGGTEVTGQSGSLGRAHGDKQMSDMTLMKVLRTAGAEDATVHGMRSAFRDWAAEQTSYPGDVVEAALAHTITNRVEAAYRRTNYLEKRRGLMDVWASFIAVPATSVV